MIIMSGGFSSRSTAVHVAQFPQRDEALMSEDPGFSNSKPVDDTEDKAVKTVKDEQAEAEAKVVKPAVKKTASKKG